MTVNEAIQLARSLGVWTEPFHGNALQKVVNRAMEIEREACAKVADADWAWADCAAAIRARGEK